jgi:hypothetical protein
LPRHKHGEILALVTVYRIFDFEREADPDLQWIPYVVRMKLDLCGLKIGLAQWQALAPQVRQSLLEAPAESNLEIEQFASRLGAELSVVGEQPPERLPEARRAAVASWKEPCPVASAVAEALASEGVPDRWNRLDRLGRYLVYTLATKRETARLASALKEIEREPQSRPHG